MKIGNSNMLRTMKCDSKLGFNIIEVSHCSRNKSVVSVVPLICVWWPRILIIVFFVLLTNLRHPLFTPMPDVGNRSKGIRVSYSKYDESWVIREDYSSKGTPGKTHNSVSSNREHATRNLLYRLWREMRNETRISHLQTFF